MSFALSPSLGFLSFQLFFLLPELIDLQSFGEGRGEGRGDTRADIRDEVLKLIAGDNLVGVRHEDETERFGDSRGDECVCCKRKSFISKKVTYFLLFTNTMIQHLLSIRQSLIFSGNVKLYGHRICFERYLQYCLPK